MEKPESNPVKMYRYDPNKTKTLKKIKGNIKPKVVEIEEGEYEEKITKEQKSHAQYRKIKF